MAIEAIKGIKDPQRVGIGISGSPEPDIGLEEKVYLECLGVFCLGKTEEG